MQDTNTTVLGIILQIDFNISQNKKNKLNNVQIIINLKYR